MRDHRTIGTLAIAIAVVLSSITFARSWERVKTRDVRTLEVTGSAKRRITSDLIGWTATLSTRSADRQDAYKQVHEHAARTLAYLEQQGLTKAEIRPSSVSVTEVIETEYLGTGEQRIERPVSRGFAATQTIAVSSTQVDRVERISREVTALIESGVPVVSAPPSYFYTKLGELKIEMLAEASKDARVRAEKMLGALAGGHLGRLKTADMGVINVNPANSTAAAWDGTHDTTSLEKDILTIVHSTYEIE
jgi:hypothetical protein